VQAGKTNPIFLNGSNGLRFSISQFRAPGRQDIATSQSYVHFGHQPLLLDFLGAELRSGNAETSMPACWGAHASKFAIGDGGDALQVARPAVRESLGGRCSGGNQTRHSPDRTIQLAKAFVAAAQHGLQFLPPLSPCALTTSSDFRSNERQGKVEASLTTGACRGSSSPSCIRDCSQSRGNHVGCSG
jgi:hypothetical protein